MSISFLGRVIGTLSGCFMISLSWASTPWVDAERLTQPLDTEWPGYGRNYQEQRFSPLDQIDQASVAQLGLSGYFDTDFNRGLEGTPVVVGDWMFVTGNWSVLYALDARTGELRWKYDPQVPREWAKMACCDVVNRGAAVWQDKVVFGTLDGRLIAVDMASGEKAWETRTFEMDQPRTITGAPRVFKDKVVIGFGGAEYGVRGYVSAYDMHTGELVWRFFTVPGNPADGFESEAMANAANTWTGEWWRYGGGGTVWDSMVYDPELDQLYLGVGNGSPWNRRIRSPEGGDNLYLSSIVALNPDTGAYLWHYQETPAESWDYTATQAIMLADMEIDGEPRKVIWHAPKNGFFFIIDRTNGQLISAEPYVTVTWATHYDLTTGRPVETPNAAYESGRQLVKPSAMGGHNWPPMSYSPRTGLVYIPAHDTIQDYREVLPMVHHWGHWNVGVNMALEQPDNQLLSQALTKAGVKGFLLAWDPKTQQAAWRLPHPMAWNGGTLATAGDLVFQGTGDGRLLAVNATSGEIVWQYDTRVGVVGSPISYAIDGEQYIAVMAGWGGAFGLASGLPIDHKVPPSRVLVFKLGGEQVLPALQPLDALPPPPERLTDDEATLTRGKTLFHTYCAPCHGQQAVSNGAIPDLRRLPPLFYEYWDQIVLDGMMRKAGMVGFKDVLSHDDAQAIKAWVAEQAHQDRALQAQSAWWVDSKRWLYDRVAALLMWLM